MIADIINDKKINSVVTELFFRGRKLNISIVFITQSYFKVWKDVRLNSNHFFIMKVPNKRELQQIALNDSSDIDFKDFIKIYKKCTVEPYSFLVNDATLASDNPLRFRKSILKEIFKTIMNKYDKYEYLTGGDILPSNQLKIKEKKIDKDLKTKRIKSNWRQT